MNFKRFIINRVLSKRQREILWAALLFSAHTYKRRGNMDGFAVVSRVIEELKTIMGFEERTWTKEEVEALIEESSEVISRKVNQIAKESYDKGVRAGRSEAALERISEENALGELLTVGLAMGIVPKRTEEFSKEKCESCESKEECDLYNAVLKEQFEEDEREEAEAKKDLEKAEETAEQSNEGGDSTENEKKDDE